MLDDRHDSAAPARLRDYLLRDPESAALFRKIRAKGAGVVNSSYDISRTCNLKCEGCLFFEGSDWLGHGDTQDLADWDRFFAAEKARGVNYVFLAGGEPALVQDRLRVAARHIGRGVVFTNGTIALDPELPFTIHVSVWGAPGENGKFRGAETFEKSIRLYANDPRARFVMTLNAENYRSAGTVAQICQAAGVKLSFSLFSQTEQYRQKLAQGAANDDAYFRISNANQTMAFTPAQLADVRDHFAQVTADYPDTVIYSEAYNRFVTDPAGLYQIDPITGWAIDCETRRAPYHVHYRTDMTSSGGKCCSPNIDCADCRAYSMALGTAVSRFKRFAATYEGFVDWIRITDQWGRLFFHDWDTPL